MARLSVPSPGDQRPEVGEVIDPIGREIFGGFEQFMLADPQEFGVRCEASFVPGRTWMRFFVPRLMHYSFVELV